MSNPQKLTIQSSKLENFGPYHWKLVAEWHEVGLVDGYSWIDDQGGTHDIRDVVKILGVPPTISTSLIFLAPPDDAPAASSDELESLYALGFPNSIRSVAKELVPHLIKRLGMSDEALDQEDADFTPGDLSALVSTEESAPAVTPVDAAPEETESTAEADSTPPKNAPEPVATEPSADAIEEEAIPQQSETEPEPQRPASESEPKVAAVEPTPDVAPTPVTKSEPPAATDIDNPFLEGDAVSEDEIIDEQTDFLKKKDPGKLIVVGILAIVVIVVVAIIAIFSDSGTPIVDDSTATTTTDSIEEAPAIEPTDNVVDVASDVASEMTSEVEELIEETVSSASDLMTSPSTENVTNMTDASEISEGVDAPSELEDTIKSEIETDVPSDLEDTIKSEIETDAPVAESTSEAIDTQSIEAPISTGAVKDSIKVDSGTDKRLTDALVDGIETDSLTDALDSEQTDAESIPSETTPALQNRESATGNETTTENSSGIVAPIEETTTENDSGIVAPIEEFPDYVPTF